jgi:hypothetical protein
VSKIIIDDRNNNTAQAMSLVAKVMSNGMVSGEDKDCYCYITIFENDVIVSADKLKSGTHKFTVYK